MTDYPHANALREPQNESTLPKPAFTGLVWGLIIEAVLTAAVMLGTMAWRLL
jgi:hypothetical protein